MFDNPPKLFRWTTLILVDHTKINPEDTLVAYGLAWLLESLDNRLEDAAGEKEHENALSNRIKSRTVRITSAPPDK